MNVRRTALLTALLIVAAATAGRAQENAALNAARPIDAGDSLWTEELTWMEVPAWLS